MPRYVIRYGVMRQLGVFSARGRDVFLRGNRVIARTPRGQEAGEVLCEATDAVLAQMPPSPESTRDGGQIVRMLSHDDETELRRLFEQERQEFTLCQQRIKESGLDMRLVDVEHLYGGERVVVYYLSELRVDFRELVKLLAKDFQTRVEMRQIGVRDEAKLLADYGDCGKPVCCNTHLSEMPPVSMKMAKLQKATLDPTKISGRCGRLKCCLRYEYDTYRDLQRELPRVGADIVTNTGRPRVLAQEILASQLLVETEDGRRVVIEAADVLTILPGRGAPPPSDDDDDDRPTRRPSPHRGSRNDSPTDSRREPISTHNRVEGEQLPPPPPIATTDLIGDTPTDAPSDPTTAAIGDATIDTTGDATPS